MIKRYILEVDDQKKCLIVQRLEPMDGPEIQLYYRVEEREPILSMLIAYEMKALEAEIEKGKTDE